MNKFILKTVSLFLIVLISLLVLDFFEIITFDKLIRNLLYLITGILIIFSSTAVICTNKNGLNKFINALILTSTTTGLILYVLQNTLNKIIYISLLLTVIYALMDMLYNKNRAK